MVFQLGTHSEIDMNNQQKLLYSECVCVCVSLDEALPVETLLWRWCGVLLPLCPLLPQAALLSHTKGADPLPVSSEYWTFFLNSRKIN